MIVCFVEIVDHHWLNILFIVNKTETTQQRNAMTTIFNVPFQSCFLVKTVDPNIKTESNSLSKESWHK